MNSAAVHSTAEKDWSMQDKLARAREMLGNSRVAVRSIASDICGPHPTNEAANLDVSGINCLADDIDLTLDLIEQATNDILEEVNHIAKRLHIG